MVASEDDWIFIRGNFRADTSLSKGRILKTL